MTHRKKLTRHDGSVVIIVVELNAYGNGGFELADVLIAKTSRSKAVTVCDYEASVAALRNPTKRLLYGHLNDLNARAAYRQQEFLKHVTPSEVLAAKLELWEKIKPTI